MKLELIGHDEKYALEQSLLTLFPGEKPVYGTVNKTVDTRWARVTLTEARAGDDGAGHGRQVRRPQLRLSPLRHGV